MLQKLDDLLTLIRFAISIYGHVSLSVVYCFRVIWFILTKRMNPNEKECDAFLDKWNELQPAIQRAMNNCHDPRVGVICAYAAFSLTIGMRDIKYMLKAKSVCYDDLTDALKMRRLMINEFLMPLIQDKPWMQTIVNAEINELMKIRKYQ